jgi:drug/metabolite transporter (DMT)-like permease
VQAQRIGLTAAMAAGVAWGAMFPILGNLLHVFDPFWLTSIRYIGASIVLLALLLAFEGPTAFRLEGRGVLLAVAGTAGIAVFNVFVLSGMRATGPEHGGLIVATGPLFTTFILWARKGIKPANITLGMVALALIGVALVVTKGNFQVLFHGGSGLGDAMIALGVFGVSYYTAVSGEFRHWSWLRFTTITLGFGTIATLVFSAIATMFGIAHPPSAPIGTMAIAGMLYMIFIGAVFAFATWNVAVAKIGAQSAALFMNAVPIVTFAIELLIGRRFLPIEYAGAALTIVALVINNIATRQRLAAEPKLQHVIAESGPRAVA